MSAVSFGESFIALFAGFGIAPLFLALVGILLMAVEMFRQAKGRFLAAGVALAAVGVVVRMLNGGTMSMLLWMLLLISAAVLPIHISSLFLHKRPWLYRSKVLALQEEASDPDNYEFLVGLIGITVTDVNDSGSMVINDITFFVSSARFIERGSDVRVVAVEGERILVVKE